MADNTRKTSNLVNTIPLSYDDSTVAQQPSRPIRGDLWFTSTTRLAKPKQAAQAKTETKKRKPLKRITDLRPKVKQLRSKKNGN